MKDILKLVKEYNATKHKKEHLLVLLERSRKTEFPIYSLILLLNSINKKPPKIVSSEGWIERDVDLKIEKLQKERDNIEKEKENLKKAQLEFEKTLKEEENNAKQIAAEAAKSNNDLNTPIIESIDSLEQTSTSNYSMNQPQKLPNAKETFILGVSSLVGMFIFPLIFDANYFSFLSIILSIITLIISTKGKKLYQNNIASGKYSTSSYTQLKTGRIMAFIPLGLVLLTIILALLVGIISIFK